MRVQLRIAGARCAVSERRRDQTVSGLKASTAMASAHRGRGALEVADGFLHRAIVRVTNSRPQTLLPTPKSTLTLFGAENVRWNPATRTALDAARSGKPSRG